MAVYLPAIAARPDETERRALKALCVYWGLIFQAIDDLGDLEKGDEEAGKSTGRDDALARPNLALVIGAGAARVRIARLASQAERALRRLEARGARWSYLRRFQTEAAKRSAAPAAGRPAQPIAA